MSDYLCNLVIPGAAKSGTSSLHDLLNQHPDICMSDRKEPHYFCREDVYARGPEFHNGLFHDRGQARIFGESSTGYLIWPEAIARIRGGLEDPKIIILLREPVARAFSHYRWRYRLGLETRSFLRAMQEDGDGFDPMQPDRFGYRSYLQFSRYSEYCPLWEQAFGADKVLMIDSDTLKTDHVRVQTRCFDFLGVADLPAKHAVTVNTTEDNTTRGEILGPIRKLMPKRLWHSGPYQALRKTLRRRLSPTPPATMSPEERAFAERELAEDRAYFHGRSG